MAFILVSHLPNMFEIVEMQNIGKLWQSEYDGLKFEMDPLLL